MVYQIEIVNSQGSTILNIVIDYKMCLDLLMEKFQGHLTCVSVIGKFYGRHRNMLLPRITKHQLAEQLSQLFKTRTLLVEYSSTGIDRSCFRIYLLKYIEPGSCRNKIHLVFYRVFEILFPAFLAINPPGSSLCSFRMNPSDIKRIRLMLIL